MNPREFCQEPGFETAILLTYSLDPIFFERIVLRDLRAGGSSDIVVIADAGQVAGSLGRWAGQLRELGRRYQLILANVRGAFHPKALVRIGASGALVWVGSGNVTRGGWGCNLELAAGWKIGRSATDSGAWLGGLLDTASMWIPQGLEHNVILRARKAQWLAEAKDESVPSPVVISQDQKALGAQIAERWAGRKFTEVLLATGSTDTGGELLRWFHKTFGVERAVLLLNPETASLDPDALHRLPIEVQFRRPRQSHPLHAKFYWFEGPDGQAAIMGSANCSTVAWLVAPQHGGNVEMIAVYDQPSRDAFEQVLESFEPDKTWEVVLAAPLHDLSDRANVPHPEYCIAEVAFERRTGSFKVTFLRPLPEGCEVTVQINDHSIVCNPSDANRATWFAATSDLFEFDIAVFVQVIIRLPDGSSLPPCDHWVNDLEALKSAGATDRIVKVLSSLCRPQTLNEQQKLVQELQKIGKALLSDSEAFPDPLSFRHGARAGEDRPGGAFEEEPCDPEKLIRSLEEPQYVAERSASISALRGFTLAGVMRALFGPDLPHPDERETDAAEEFEDSETPSIEAPAHGRRGVLPEVTNPPAETLRKKLRKHMSQFLDCLREAELAQSCTATQMVQAAAFPLALGVLGVRHRWVDVNDARDWTARVYDTLFRHPYATGGAKGLLDAVHQRYVAHDRDREFRLVVGDGTLWTAMLLSLWELPWSGTASCMKKSLALRAVWRSQELLASAEMGRMLAFVSRLEQQFRVKSLLAAARETVAVLDELERHLADNFAKLKDLQLACGTLHRINDLLWHPTGGWAFALQEVAVTQNEKLCVYRQNAATEVKVSAAFYLNISQAAAIDPRTADALRRLEQCNARAGSGV